MNNNDFAKFIDEIRESRKMSREELVDSILSIRQYFRFIKGESSLRTESLNQLFHRLEVAPHTAYRLFNRKYNEPNQRLSNVYQELFKRDSKSASKLLNDIDFDSLTYESQQKYYRILEAMIQSNLGLKPYSVAADKVMEVIDYPNVIDKEIINYYENIGLVFILKHLMTEKDYRLAKVNYDFLMDESNANNYHSLVNKVAMCMGTSQMLGYIEEYEKSLKIAEKGLDMVYKETNYMMMIPLFLLQAMAEKRLYDDHRYKKTVRKIYMLLYIYDSKQWYDDYVPFIEKQFNLKESDLLKY